MAERMTIDRPPTCESGSAHSQRSAGSRPSATAEPSALHSQLPYVSSTALGVPLVPEVCTTIAGASRSWRSRRRASEAGVRDDGAVDDLGRALHDALALARAQAQVDRDGDRAQAQDRVQRDAEGLARGQRDADAVAGAYPAAGQAPRRRVDLAEQLGVGQRVHGRAVGMALGRPRQPGIDEHGVAR